MFWSCARPTFTPTKSLHSTQHVDKRALLGPSSASSCAPQPRSHPAKSAFARARGSAVSAAVFTPSPSQHLLRQTLLRRRWWTPKRTVLHAARGLLDTALAPRSHCTQSSRARQRTELSLHQSTDESTHAHMNEPHPPNLAVSLACGAMVPRPRAGSTKPTHSIAVIQWGLATRFCRRSPDFGITMTFFINKPP